MKLASQGSCQVVSMCERKVLLLAVVTDVHDSCVTYPSCNSCCSKLLVDSTTNRYHCVRCGQWLPEGSVQWRYRLVVSVTDGSCITSVVIFGRTLEPFFGKSASDFHKSLCDLEQNGYPAEEMLTDSLLKTFHGKYFYYGFKLPSLDHKQDCPPSLKDLEPDTCSQGSSQWQSTPSGDMVHKVTYQMLQTNSGVYATVTDHMRYAVKALRGNVNRTQENALQDGNKEGGAMSWNDKQQHDESEITSFLSPDFNSKLDSVRFSFENVESVMEETCQGQCYFKSFSSSQKVQKNCFDKTSSVPDSLTWTTGTGHFNHICDNDNSNSRNTPTFIHPDRIVRHLTFEELELSPYNCKKPVSRSNVSNQKDETVAGKDPSFQESEFDSDDDSLLLLAEEKINSKSKNSRQVSDECALQKNSNSFNKIHHPQRCTSIHEVGTQNQTLSTNVQPNGLDLLVGKASYKSNGTLLEERLLDCKLSECSDKEVMMKNEICDKRFCDVNLPESEGCDVNLPESEGFDTFFESSLELDKEAYVLMNGVGENHAEQSTVSKTQSAHNFERPHSNCDKTVHLCDMYSGKVDTDMSGLFSGTRMCMNNEEKIQFDEQLPDSEDIDEFLNNIPEYCEPQLQECDYTSHSTLSAIAITKQLVNIKNKLDHCINHIDLQTASQNSSELEKFLTNISAEDCDRSFKCEHILNNEYSSQTYETTAHTGKVSARKQINVEATSDELLFGDALFQLCQVIESQSSAESLGSSGDGNSLSDNQSEVSEGSNNMVSQTALNSDSLLDCSSTFHEAGMDSSIICSSQPIPKEIKTMRNLCLFSKGKTDKTGKNSCLRRVIPGVQHQMEREDTTACISLKDKGLVNMSEHLGGTSLRVDMQVDIERQGDLHMSRAEACWKNNHGHDSDFSVVNNSVDLFETSEANPEIQSAAVEEHTLSCNNDGNESCNNSLFSEPLDFSTPGCNEIVVVESPDDVLGVDSNNEESVVKTDIARRVKFSRRLRTVSSCHLMDIKMRLNGSPQLLYTPFASIKSCLKRRPEQLETKKEMVVEMYSQLQNMNGCDDENKEFKTDRFERTLKKNQGRYSETLASEHISMSSVGSLDLVPLSQDLFSPCQNIICNQLSDKRINKDMFINMGNQGNKSNNNSASKTEDRSKCVLISNVCSNSDTHYPKSFAVIPFCSQTDSLIEVDEKMLVKKEMIQVTNHCRIFKDSQNNGSFDLFSDEMSLTESSVCKNIPVSKSVNCSNPRTPDLFDDDSLVMDDELEKENITNTHSFIHVSRCESSSSFALLSFGLDKVKKTDTELISGANTCSANHRNNVLNIESGPHINSSHVVDKQGTKELPYGNIVDKGDYSSNTSPELFADSFDEGCRQLYEVCDRSAIANKQYNHLRSSDLCKKLFM